MMKHMLPFPLRAPRRRFSRSVANVAVAFLIAPLFGARAPVPDVAPPPLGILSLHETRDVLVIQYGGKAGAVGIPSWKAVVHADDGGNITAFHVPAHNPVSLGSRDAHDPMTMVSGRNGEGLVPTLYKGRDHYVGFRPERFEVGQKSSERIVLHVAGPSKHRFYVHDRTYLFTAAGVEISGWIDPLVNLEVVSFMPHWDRRQLADTHMNAVPLRTQGRHGWIPMLSSGQDGASSLPGGVDFPLEMELKLRLATPTFVRLFIDQPFDAAAGTKRFVHNNKDMFLNVADRVLYEKLTGITGFPVAKGARQNYKVRFGFETQIWPAVPATDGTPANTPK